MSKHTFRSHDKENNLKLETQRTTGLPKDYNHIPRYNDQQATTNRTAYIALEKQQIDHLTFEIYNLHSNIHRTTHNEHKHANKEGLHSTVKGTAVLSVEKSHGCRHCLGVKKFRARRHIV